MASFCDLPDEIILHVLSFLPSKFQILKISVVCRRLKELLTSSWYWRSQYIQLCGSQPDRELSTIRLWQKGCIQSEFALAAARGNTNLNSLKGMIMLCNLNV